MKSNMTTDAKAEPLGNYAWAGLAEKVDKYAFLFMSVLNKHV